jgi:hypothetical protein
VSFAPSRYVAAAAALACAGFGLLGVMQSLRYTPDISEYGVPAAVTQSLANGVSFLGLPMYRWAAKKNVEIILALPDPLKVAAIRAITPVPEEAKGWSAPAVLRPAAGPVASQSRGLPMPGPSVSRSARPAHFASLPISSAALSAESGDPQ